GDWQRDLDEVFADEPEDRFGFLRELGIRPDQVDPDFGYRTARRAAIDLHQAIERLPGAQEELRALLRRRPAELVAIRRQYRDMYGFDPRYQLGSVLPEDPDRVDEYASQIESGFGKAAQPLVDAARSTGGKAEVMRLVLQLSAADRARALADTASLGELRKRLGASAYDDLFQILAGHASVFAALDAGGDLTDNVQKWFEGRRETLLVDPELVAAAAGEPRRLSALVDARLQREGREAFADPAVQQLLASKTGGSADDAFEVRARLLRGGRLTAKDKATRAVIEDGDTDEDALRESIDGMSDAERAEVAADPFSQRRFASDLEDGGSDDKDADRVFSSLFASDGRAKLEATRNVRAPGALYQTEFDGEKALGVVLAMSQAELAALRADPDLAARVRGSLLPGPRERFDAYLNAASPLTTPDRAGAFWVEQYAARFLHARRSAVDALKVAVACHARGRVEPAPGAPAGGRFDAPERRAIWERIDGELDIDDDSVLAIEASLLDLADPTPRLLAVGFQGKDRQAVILAAIDEASPETALGWSNVDRPGPTPEYGTLAAKFEAYLAAEARWRGETDEQSRLLLEPEYLVAKNRFVDHHVDLSVETLAWFSDGGGDLRQLWPNGKVFMGGAVADRPSDKALLEMKGHLRARVLRLTSDQVAARLGFAAPAGAASADPAEQRRASREGADYAAKKAMLMSDDRIARSEVNQRADTFRHEDSGSGTDGERQRYRDGYHRYGLEQGRATGDGTMSDEALRRLRARGEDVDRLLKELKEARASLLSFLEALADALILLVAVAITGPAGLGFLASMMVAAATSISHSVLEEMVDPANHTFDEAANNLLRSLGTTALTHGVGKALGSARKPLGLGGPAQKLETFEKSLTDRASRSLWGLPLNAAYNTGKGVLTGPLDAVSQTAWEMLDPG
ncbi:MAG: hypothetical protein ABMA64_38875, partial [Myxococcota bacterium]